jgi:cytochrome c peroxidase
MRTATPLLGLASILALGAAFAGCSDRKTVVHASSQESALQAELASLLTTAGATTVTAPATEDPALVELGRSLFFDKLLSGNRNISCATCHHPTAGTGDNLPLSLGEGASGVAQVRSETESAQVIPRNAPDVFNDGVSLMSSMFWDSRVTRDATTGALKTPEPALNGASPTRADITALLTSALAAQAMFPVTSTEEMRGKTGENEIADAANNLQVWERLMARLVGTGNGSVGGVAGYRTLFRAAYPAVTNYDDLNFGHAARAIAAFEREVWTALDTPYDRYLGGETTALSEPQLRGAVLFFGRAKCSDCHSGPLLTDLKHYALAVPQLGHGKGGEPDDRGLALESGSAADNYKFRTPALRNVALTGPWMHSGAFDTLEAAVRHHLDPASGLLNYDASHLRPVFRNTLDSDASRRQARITAIDPILLATPQLNRGEVDDLLAFLEALTDPASLNLLRDAPASVPSGLPVND